MNEVGAASVAADVQRLRERVRADRRTVTAPLLVFGVLILLRVAALGAVAASGSENTHLLVLLYWPLAAAAGLFVLWGHAHRLADRDGVGEGPRSYRPVALGYLVSMPVIAFLLLPVLIISIWVPLAWPAAVLAAVGIRQHSRALTGTARALAAAAAVQLLLALLTSADDGTPAWVSYGLEGAVGVGLVTGALVLARRARSV